MVSYEEDGAFALWNVVKLRGDYVQKCDEVLHPLFLVREHARRD